MASIASVTTWLRNFSGAPPPVKLWALNEFARRAILRNVDFCDTVILSYPRSGNHLVRYMVELLLERPTLGDVDDEKFYIPRNLPDAPILSRLGNRKFKSLRPTAVKRHTLVGDRSFGRMIIVVRDPVEAVLSHTRDLSDDDFKGVVQSEVRKYLKNVEAFLRHPGNSRLLVSYEDLQVRPLKVLGALADFLDQESSSDARGQENFDTSIAKKALVREPSPTPVPYKVLFTNRAERTRDLLHDADETLTEAGITY